MTIAIAMMAGRSLRGAPCSIIAADYGSRGGRKKLTNGLTTECHADVIELHNPVEKMS